MRNTAEKNNLSLPVSSGLQWRRIRADRQRRPQGAQENAAG